MPIRGSVSVETACTQIHFPGKTMNKFNYESADPIERLFSTSWFEFTTPCDDDVWRSAWMCVLVAFAQQHPIGESISEETFGQGLSVRIIGLRQTVGATASFGICDLRNWLWFIEFSIGFGREERGKGRGCPGYVLSLESWISLHHLELPWKMKLFEFHILKETLKWNH